METKNFSPISLHKIAAQLALLGALGFLSNCGMTEATITPVSGIAQAASKSSDNIPSYVQGTFQASNLDCDNGSLYKATERTYRASLQIAADTITLKTGINMVSEGTTALTVATSTITSTNSYAITSSDIDQAFGIFEFGLGSATWVSGKKDAAYDSISYDELEALATTTPTLKLVQIFSTDTTKAMFSVTAANSPLCSGGTLTFEVTAP